MNHLIKITIKNKLMFLFMCLILFHTPLFPQTGSITNIQVSQRTDGSGNVDIYYNLTGPDPIYFVSLEVSFNNGSTFTSVSSTYLSGNIGVTPGTNRHIVWNGKGSNNNAYSTQTKVKLIAKPCGQPITDTRDGKTYNTVPIGTQCWMVQNLNIGTRINGSVNQTNNSIIEKYCSKNLESNCNIYGGLYQWNEAMQYSTTPGVQGICPTGWHLPTDGEWTTLTTFLGGESVAGGKMKEAGYSHWLPPNTGATNSSGFTALPGGAWHDGGSFGSLTYYAVFWSSSQYDDSFAWDRDIYYGGVYVDRALNYKTKNGYSARCVQN